jgi:hypothetical protein
MSEYYKHLLIARRKDFVPSAKQVQEFLGRMDSLGVVPGKSKVSVSVPSERTRTGVNPFTGEKVVFKARDFLEPGSCEGLAGTIADRIDYEARLNGEDRPTSPPRLPPVPLDFDEPYCVSVCCYAKPELRSTSYVLEGSEPGLDIPYYGEPCNPDSTMGYFRHPTNGPLIQVPDGGCARFWIEIELGKNLFPRYEKDDLNILHPQIVEEAKRVFGTDFVQGYQWG